MNDLKKLTMIATCVAATLFCSATAWAQDGPPPHKPLEKTIGQARPEVVPSLIVLNADGATLEGSTLTLKDVAQNAIVFADRPVRAAGHATVADLLSEWNEGSESFAADPPNATVSVFGDSADQIADIVVTLRSPAMSGEDLVFDVDVLEGDLWNLTGPAAVFIDRIGRPLTPISGAGVARRTAARAAMYQTTNAETWANQSPCGYADYPPCPQVRY
ncbi:hypothetical protein [Tropicimonas sp. IMCC6043]|uniref:hypothetical protein n=1 Tax=Tropicimonas sp. IMCC6043 TaxID=2510645 RepID=UPI00101C5A37|nr:hypothetical protein [Tropicimonas sp. IMCC6043]RYH08757.1 hypothetical protein EU800_14835 [Tropicimonas sp. IMCC6043]